MGTGPCIDSPLGGPYHRNHCTKSSLATAMDSVWIAHDPAGNRSPHAEIKRAGTGLWLAPLQSAGKIRRPASTARTMLGARGATLLRAAERRRLACPPDIGEAGVLVNGSNAAGPTGAGRR